MLRAAFVLCLSAASLSGQGLVRDINQGPAGSNPADFTNYRGLLVFTARGEGGRELWISDGSEGGTFEVDVWPGPESSDPKHLTVWGGRLYFLANDHVSGGRSELHVTDGTPEGTLSIGKRAVEPLVATDTTLYFRATNESGVYSLWTSDGSWGGTVELLGSAVSSTIAPVGDRVFFMGKGDGGNFKPWVSDGTEKGTFKVFSPLLIHVFSFNEVTGGAVFFTNGGQGFEPEPAGIYFSDGTPSGASLVDEFPETGLDVPDLFSIGDVTLYKRQATDLWRTDGTPAGTFKLLDGDPTVLSQQSFYIEWGTVVRAGNRAYFWVHTGFHWNSLELWASDGTILGTTLVAKHAPGAGGAFDTEIGATGTGSAIAFQWNDGPNGREIWIHNDAGTEMLTQTVPGPLGGWSPGRFARAGDFVFFTASLNGLGEELYAFPFPDAGAWVVEPYGVSCASGDPARLEMSGKPEPDGTVSLDITGALESAPVGILYSLSGVGLPLPGGCEWLIGIPNWLLTAGVADGAGDFSLPFTWLADPALVALPIYFQSLSVDPGSAFSGVALTNGLEVRGAP